MRGNNLSLSKKIILIAAEYLALVLCYSLVMCLFNIIFDEKPLPVGGIFIQGFVFAVIYIPFQSYFVKRRNNNNKD